MALKYVDLDNEKQANDYKDKKRHNRFLRDTRNDSNNDPVPTNDIQEDKKEEAPAPVNETPKKRGIVKGVDQLRVRDVPEGEIIDLLKKGTEFDILGRPNDCWYKIKTQEGTVGYVMVNFVLEYIEGETNG